VVIPRIFQACLQFLRSAYYKNHSFFYKIQTWNELRHLTCNKVNEQQQKNEGKHCKTAEPHFVRFRKFLPHPPSATSYFLHCVVFMTPHHRPGIPLAGSYFCDTATRHKYELTYLGPPFRRIAKRHHQTIRRLSLCQTDAVDNLQVHFQGFVSTSIYPRKLYLHWS